jgi:hypothetical protein
MNIRQQHPSENHSIEHLEPHPLAFNSIPGYGRDPRYRLNAAAFPSVSAIVPAGEEFDETAFSGEGVFLSDTHFKAIEEQLASVAVKDARIKELELQVIAGAQNTSGEVVSKADYKILQKQVSTQRTLISSLQNQVKPGGVPGTLPVRTAGSVNKSAKLPSYLDPENPINKGADSFLRPVREKEKERKFLDFDL